MAELIEEWRAIHDGFYEVSDIGNVRRAKPGIATFIGRPVNVIHGGNGYGTVGLSGLTARRAYVHHLIAEAFLGDRPAGMVINHKDGNRMNNCLDNLEYVTRSDNAIHAKRLPRRKGPNKPKPARVGPPRGDNHWSHRNPEKIARGDAMPHCKLSADIVRTARARAANGEMQKKLAAEYGVSIAQMSRVIRGIRWTYL